MRNQGSDSGRTGKRPTRKQVGFVVLLLALFVAGVVAAGATGTVLDTITGSTDTSSVSTSDTAATSTGSTTADTTTALATSTTTATTATTTSTDPTSTAPTSSGAASTANTTVTYTPTIMSDQSDYVPGSTVTITGAGWPANDLLKVFTNDSVGQTWSDTGYPETDANGDFTYTFTLPDYFVASYTSAASDSSGLSVSTTFTDGNVQVVGDGSPTGTFSFTVGVTAYSDTACTSNASVTRDNTFSTTAGTISPGANKDGNGNNANSYLLHEHGASTDGRTFTGWNSGGTADICAPSPATGTTTEMAHFGAVPASDTTAPTVNASLHNTLPVSGWFTSSPQQVDVSAFDPSGVTNIQCKLDAGSFANAASQSGAGTSSSVPRTGSFSVTGDGAHTVTCQATDGASPANTGAASGSTASVAVKIDTVNPLVAITSPSDGSSTTASTVTVSGNVSDATSGVKTVTVNGTGASVSSGTFSLTNFGLTCGSNTITALATDNADNTASSTVTVTRTCDTTPPVITPTVTGTLGNGGWYTSDVSVSWSVTDPESTITSQTGCTTTNVTADTASVTFTCSATSSGGSNSQSVTVKRDATAPTITDLGPTPSTPNGLHGWYVTSVSNAFEAADGGSGLSAGCIANFALANGHNTESKTTSGDGAALTVTSDSCTDVAGNTASGKTSASFKVDTTAPVLVTKPTDDACSLVGDHGWCRGTQTAGFRATDATSGFDATGTSPFDFTKSTTTNGAAVTIASGAVSDWAGNTATSINSAPFAIDSVSPTISDLGPTPASPNGNNGWYVTSVANAFEASDATSGLSSACVLNFPLVAGHYTQSKSTSGEGAAKTVTSDSCTDDAGNPTAGVVSASFKVDLVNPVVTCPTAPTFLASQLPQTITASVTDTPAGSAPLAATASGTASNLNGGTVGITGLDIAGRSTTAQCAYHVGNTTFVAPIDKAPIMNIAKLGRVVPVKLNFTYDGAPITSTGTVYVGGMSQVSCTDASGGDVVDVYAAGASNSGNLFRWDSTGPFWIYNFDTSAFSMKAGNCYRINVYYGGSVSGTTASGGSLVGYFLMQTTK